MLDPTEEMSVTGTIQNVIIVEEHKSTTNLCSVRAGYLTIRVINNVNLRELVCPFGKILINNKEAGLAPENAPISDFNKEWPLVN